MVTIEHNGDRVEFNNLGFITHWSSNPLVNESHPIYLVLFGEYSRLNPFCQPLDTSECIRINSQDKNRLIYTKKIDKFSFGFEIIITDTIRWVFYFDPTCINHSIGLALPYNAEWHDFYNPIQENVANYYVLQKNSFPDQYTLDLPCVCSDNLSVCGDSKSSYQFFRYQDEIPWLRVTTSTSTEKAATVYMQTNKINEKSYLSKFPRPQNRLSNIIETAQITEGPKYEEDLLAILSEKIDSIQIPGDVTAWMDLCRHARQPRILWHVEYVEPRASLITANAIIRESELFLYDSSSSTTLKEGYTADLQQQAAFNTIRAHLRSEEGDFASPLDIFRSLHKNFYDKLTTIRQSNLLMHCCLASVCCGEFKESYDGFKQHWDLLESLSEEQRLSLGIWDNHIILHMAYWFLSYHIQDFRNFYEAESGVANIMAHKKISLLKFLNCDQTWIASFMGKPFYDHLCEQYPSVPTWKASIIENRSPK